MHCTKRILFPHTHTPSSLLNVQCTHCISESKHIEILDSLSVYIDKILGVDFRIHIYTRIMDLNVGRNIKGFNI